jgi:hypothetical protein
MPLGVALHLVDYSYPGPAWRRWLEISHKGRDGHNESQKQSHRVFWLQLKQQPL